MQKPFSYWKLLRYVVSGIVAIWGFVLIFTEGINSGGKVLLIISGIGVLSTVLFDAFNQWMFDRKATKAL